MAQPINHSIPSEIATGVNHTAIGAGVGALSLPIAGGALGLLAGAALGAFALSGVGTVAMLAAGAIGAAVGGLGGTAAGTALALTPPGLMISGALAALGGLLGMGKAANQISNEKAAYQKQQMNAQRMGAEERSVIANQGMYQGYQAGFQEGAAMGEQQAFAKMQQAVQEQAVQQNTLMGQAPVEGAHVQKLGRAGHQHHASKTDMVTHQKEQAAAAPQQVGS